MDIENRLVVVHITDIENRLAQGEGTGGRDGLGIWC